MTIEEVKARGEIPLVIPLYAGGGMMLTISYKPDVNGSDGNDSGYFVFRLKDHVSSALEIVPVMELRDVNDERLMDLLKFLIITLTQKIAEERMELYGTVNKAMVAMSIVKEME